MQSSYLPMGKCSNAAKDDEADSSYLIPTANGMSPPHQQQLELKAVSRAPYSNSPNNATFDSKKPLLETKKSAGTDQVCRAEQNTENEYVGRDFAPSP